MTAVDPNIEQILKHISDKDLVGIIADVEHWSFEKVYEVAHKQVGIEGDPWSKFVHTGQLPITVRQELERAFWVHFNAGNFKLPMLGEGLLGPGFVIRSLKWAMIGWIIYYVLVVFFY